MAPARAAAYIGGALLLAAWLSSAATRQDPGIPPASPPQGPSDNDPIGFDVQAQAAKLRAKLAAAPAPKEPSRNPFAFAVREVPRTRELHAAAIPEPEPLPAGAPIDVEPALSLVGMAEKQGPDGPVRTAVIAGDGDEVFLVVEGQEVAGRYRVTAIAADAVELRDLVTGTVRRLLLQ